MSKVVLGGGLSGLSAAYYLRKKSLKDSITLLESSNRTGGWIKSNLQDDGTIFEEGPRTLRCRGDAAANTLQLIEELNLSNEIVAIKSDHPAATKRLIYAKGNLHLLPSSLWGLFKKQEPFSKPLILYLTNDLKASRKLVEDEPIYDFIERRFGKDIADYLISPMICGICAGNAHEISVKFLLEKLHIYEQQYGNITYGFLRNFGTNPQPKLCQLALKARAEKWSIYSFNKGCETLPLALKDNILQNNIDLKLNKSCKKIKFDKNHLTLELNNNEIIQAESLISAIPSHILANLIQEQHPELSTVLSNLVKNVSVAVVNLNFKNNLIKDDAFGFLVAPKENLPVLGVIYDSCCKNTSGTTLTVMMGGYWFEQHFGAHPAEEMLLKIATRHVKNILKLEEEPDTYKVSILRHCLPQYIVGHNEMLKNVQTYIEKHQLPLSLCGASYFGVGINDVILSAKNAVKDL